MNIYEIDKAILDCIDQETGEILDFDAFDSLQMERNTKIENVALWIKDLKAEADAIREEEKKLAERRKSNENKIERLKDYLQYALQGEKFSTPRVAVSYRNSSSVQIDNEEEFIKWAMENADELLKYKNPEISKSAITESLKAGEEVPFAQIVSKTSVTIK